MRDAIRDVSARAGRYAGTDRNDPHLGIELADIDRGVYTTLDLRVARHPSETEEFLLTRVLAYCLEYAGMELRSREASPSPTRRRSLSRT